MPRNILFASFTIVQRGLPARWLEPKHPSITVPGLLCNGLDIEKLAFFSLPEALNW